jgi:ubiquinone/menaquinone biosynthesis C-methylase UbiE
MRSGRIDEATKRLDSRRLYAHVAPIYSAYVRIGSLWAFPSLYRSGCESLHLWPGATVLDMGCGTGELFPFLHEAVTPTGRIIGCDLSGEMLAGARRRVERHGWHNVTLIQADAGDFAPPARPDAAIFSICLSAIPAREAVFDRALDFLPRGAPVAVIDSLTLPWSPGHALGNLYNRVKGRLIAADPDCGLAAFVESRLDGYEARTYRGGVYSLLSGRARGALAS